MADDEEWEEEVVYHVLDLGQESPLLMEGGYDQVSFLGLSRGSGDVRDPVIMQLNQHMYQAQKVDTIGTDLLFKVDGVKSKNIKDITVKEDIIKLSYVGSTTEKYITNEINLIPK